MATTLTGMDGTVRMRGVQFKQRAFCWNGRNRMRTYDGANWQFSAITKYPFTPTVALAGGAGNLTGQYAYIATFVNSKKFNLDGYVVAAVPGDVSATITANAQNITITGIPATHPDPQVDYVYLYRTLAGQFNVAIGDEGANYYLVAAIAIGTTSYTDTTIDAGISGSETIRFQQQIAPTFKYGDIYGDRLFGAGFDTISGDGVTTGTATLVTATITFKAIAADVATITTSAAHGYSVGQYVTVNTGSHDTTFDGTVLITATPTSTTFKYNRNNSEKTVTTIAETGTTEQLVFSNISLPDGVTGMWFQATGDSKIYRITGFNSATNVTVVGQASIGYAGTTPTGFAIFAMPWQVFFSEFGDFEAWGADGFSFINTRELPGFDPVTGLLAYNDQLWVFSAMNIYSITGKGSDDTDVNITPEPVYRGLGSMGGDAIDAVEGEIYYLSRRGPCVMANGAPPQLIGQALLTDWIDKLTDADLSISVVLCAGRYVYFCVTETSGDVEPSHAYRYDRYTQSWWQEADWIPAFGYHDAGNPGLAYYVQGASIFQPNQGATDVVATPLAGTVTAASTLSITDSTAAFPTATGGCVESTVRIFDASGNFIGKRRITSNSGTVLSWSSSGVGGGALAGITAGCTYEIGIPWWHWMTRTVDGQGQGQKAMTCSASFDHIDKTTSMRVTQYYDTPQTGGESTPKDNPQYQAIEEQCMDYDLQTGNHNYALYLESRTNARLRSIALNMNTQPTRKV